MKKHLIYKKLIVCILAVILTFSFTIFIGCSDKKTEEKTEGFTDTNFVLAENNKTDYKIVISPLANEKEQKGAEELKTIFEEYTGATINIYTDNEVELTNSSKLISIGNTNVLTKSGAKADVNLGASGFFIKLHGDNVIIGADGFFGALYGVYDFLENNLGVKFYGYDSVYYPEKKDKLLLKNFDYYEIPSFEYRTVSGKNMEYYDNTTMDRYRMTNHKNWIPGLTAHTTEAVLPYSKYGKEHPDWYSQGGGELCFTNEGARKKMAEELQKKIIESEEVCDTIMIGTMDNWDKCDCAKCKEDEKKYSYTGVYIRFVNALAEDMEKWEKENNIRRFTYSAFAYRKTQSAPTVFNREQNKHVPTDSSVVLRDNVAIRFAPLDADWNHTLNDTKYNVATKTAIEAWQAVAKKFKVWSYMLNYNEQLVWFNDFHTQKTNYQIYKDMGISEIFDQGQWDNLLPAFVAVRSYVKAQLMWDLTIDPYEKTQEFIKFYYGAAADKVQEFYDIVQLRFRMIDKHFAATKWLGQDSLITRCYTHLETNFMSETYWPYEFLIQCQKLMDEALELVKGDALLTERVTLESISADYLLLSLHSGKFSKSQYTKLIDKFEGSCRNTSVESYAENAAEHPISQKVAYFRSKVEK